MVFCIAAVKQNPISIFCWKTVRDLLILRISGAYDLAIEGLIRVQENLQHCGGPDYSISIWKEFSKILMPILGRN